MVKMGDMEKRKEKYKIYNKNHRTEQNVKELKETCNDMNGVLKSCDDVALDALFKDNELLHKRMKRELELWKKSNENMKKFLENE